MARLSVAADCFYNPKERKKFRAQVSSFVIAWILFKVINSLITSHLSAVQLPSVVLLGIGLVALDLDWNFRRYRKASKSLATRLLPAMEGKYRATLDGLLHVGIAPGKKRCDYQGDSSWDVGFLKLEGGVSYFGDQCHFHIPRRFIEKVRVVNWPTPLLQLCILGPDQTRGWISIEARDGASRTDVFATLQRLRAQIALMTDEHSSLTLPPHLVPPAEAPPQMSLA
jgi:hypothetical protein